MQLTVLGGFLGSGKTTWLRHQLHDGRFKDAFVVVNEAAETPVDAALLGGSSRLAVLAGGCACCAARDQLIELLRRLSDERSARDSHGERLQRIVLETSGLANPGAIVDAIRADPILVHHIVVSEIIVAVDGLHAMAQLKSEPLGRAQIEVADRLVVTKIDETKDQDSLARLLAALRQLNPGAAITGAIRGSDAPLPPFEAVASVALPDPSTEVDARPIFPTRLMLDQTVDWTAFSVWLSALLHARGDDVVRVKGVVRTPAGRLLVQAVRRIVQSPEILPEQDVADGREDDTIVVIGRGYRAEDLRRSLRHFARSGRS
jgi:G3E family GTPase